MRVEDLKFLVAQPFCRFRMTADNGDEVCIWHESSIGLCNRELCPLVEKFGIQVGSKEGVFEVTE